MASQPTATPLLALKIPRNVLDKLRSSDEIKLTLGGKEKGIGGSMVIAGMRFDVRYRAERGGTSLVFQGKPPTIAGGDSASAHWEPHGKVTGRLTLLPPKGSQLAERRSMARPTELTTAPLDSTQTAFSSMVEKAVAEQTQQQQQQQQLHQQQQRAKERAAAKQAPLKRPGVAAQNQKHLKQTRDRLLHYLAFQPCEEEKAIGKLKGSRQEVLDILKSIAIADGTLWTLRPERFCEVRIMEWDKYKDGLRLQVAANCLAAFDKLGLPADDPDRLRVIDVQKKLKAIIANQRAQQGAEKSGVSAAPAAAITGPPVTVAVASATSALPNTSVIRSPTVPSISLPKEASAAKKKPTRSVIAPTLAKTLGMKGAKPTKRKLTGTTDALTSLSRSTANASTGTGTGVSAGAGANTGANTGTAPTRPSVTPDTSHDTKLASKRTVLKNEDGELNDGEIREEGETSGPEYGKAAELLAPSKPGLQASRGHSHSASFQGDRQRNGPSSQSRLPVDRKRFRRLRAESDVHPASDTEADYSRPQKRPPRWSSSQSRSPIMASLMEGTFSRSHSHNSRFTDTDAADLDEQGNRRPLQLRSRPLPSQPFAFSPAVSSPQVPSIETEAAVNRVQERLAAEIGADRRISSLASANGTSDPAAISARARLPRGPSLSPVHSPQNSLSRSPAMRPQNPKTFEDLERLEQLIRTTYDEYCELRLKLDACHNELTPLADELVAAQSASMEARKRALEAKRSNEADREEGEEIPGDCSSLSELSLAIDPTTAKCTPDGCRLYVYDDPVDDQVMWLTDSPEATIDVEGTSPSCRRRRLLPEEARVMRASQRISECYRDLPGGDALRWTRRYLRLHSQLEQLGDELNKGAERLKRSMMKQVDSLRDEFNDLDMDIPDVGYDGDGAASEMLTLESYRKNAVNAQAASVE